MVARWNQLQQAFSRQLELTSDWSAPSMDLSNPRMFDLFISAAANLASSDPRNISITEVVERLPLLETVRTGLSRSGLTTLRDLARYLKAAPTLERDAELRSVQKYNQSPGIKLPFDRKTRDLIVDAIRKGAQPSSDTKTPHQGQG